MSVSRVQQTTGRPSAWAVGLLAFSVVAVMSAVGLLAVVG
jgi:hypothetical protein